MSVKECKKMSRDYQNLENDKTGEKSFEAIQNQMSFIFGGKPEDYENYSLKLLANVLKYVTEETINPTHQIQE